MPAASRETSGSAGLARFAARAADAGKVFFGGAVREYGAHGQEHRVVLGFLAVLQHVLELRGFPAHVVDNRVNDDVVGLAEFGHVIPGARRGSTLVWSIGSKPASAPSNGVKNGRTWTPSYTPAKRVRSTSVSEAMVPSPKRLA